MSAELCSVVSHREPFIDYRPHAHHRLHQRDRHFDPKFNALLRSEFYVKQAVERAVESEIRANGFVSDIGAAVLRCREQRNHAFLPLLLPTSLSDADRKLVLQRLTHLLEVELDSAVLSLSKDETNSCAYTILNNLVDKYCCQRIYKTATSKRRTSSNTTINALIQQQMNQTQQYVDHILKGQSDIFLELGRIPQNFGQYAMNLDPLSKLEQLHFAASLQSHAATFAMDTSSYCSNDLNEENACNSNSISLASEPIIVVIEYAETMLIDTLQDLLQLLSGYCNSSKSTLRIVLVLSHSQSPAFLSLQSSHTKAILCGSQVLRSISPFELYESVMSSVLAAREIPVSLPAELIGWLHEAYWRSSMCIQSVVDRIVFCLGVHFRRRSSLLCMYEDSRWLYELKILRKFGKEPKQSEIRSSSSSSSSSAASSSSSSSSKHIQLLRNVAEISCLLTSNDFVDSGISLEFVKNVLTRESALSLYRAINESTARAAIDFQWFQCLLLLRDKLIPKRRREFPSDILFGEILSQVPVSASTDQRAQAVLLPALLEAVATNLKSVPIGRLIQTIKGLVNKLSLINLSRFEGLSAIDDTSSNNSTGTSNSNGNNICEGGSGKAANDRNKLSAIESSTKFLKWFQNELRDIGYMLDEAISIMQDNAVDVNASFNTLLRMKLNGEKERSTDHSAASAKLANNNDSNDTSVLNPSKNNGVDYGASGESNQPNVSSRSAETKAAAECEGNMHTTDAVMQAATVELAEDYEAANSCLYDMDLVPLIENIIQDLVQCIRTASSKYQQLPPRPLLRGILDIHQADIQLTIAQMKGNCRYVFTEAIRNPSIIFGKNASTISANSGGSNSTSTSTGAVLGKGGPQATTALAARPDICTLTDHLVQCSGSENIYEWFAHFRQHADHWNIPIRKKRKAPESSAISSTAEKSSNNEGSDSKPPAPVLTPAEEQAQHEEALRNTQADLVKYRFIRTVNDAANVGLLTLQSNGNVLKRLAYSWMADT